MTRKFKLIQLTKRKALFFGVVIFAWINLSNANSSGMNVFQDKDQDGLTDQEELSYGTDPANPDTDGDGYSDGKEMQSGYNPLKPAPGDKLVTEVKPTQPQAAPVVSNEQPGENLTDKFIENIKTAKEDEFGLLQEISSNPEYLQDDEKLKQLQDISLTQEELDSILQESITEVNVKDELQLLSESEIKVLPRPEGKDEADIKQKEKQQIEQYLVTFGYIILKNAPFELQNESELEDKTFSFINQLTSQVENGDITQLTQYQTKAQACYTELKAIEVPFVLKDIHLTGVSIFNYLLQQQPNELTNQEDPMSLILTIGKMQSAAASLEQLGVQIENILKEYDITTLKPTAAALGITDGTASSTQKDSDDEKDEEDK